MNNFSDLYYKNILVEHTLPFLAAQSDQGRKVRALRTPGVSTSVKRGPNNTLIVYFRFKGKKAIHTSVVQFDNPRFDFFDKENTIPKLKEGLLGAEVRVYCGCPDFFLHGQKYNLGPAGKYKDSAIPLSFGKKSVAEPKVVTTPAVVNDPKKKHVLCKHLIAIANNIAHTGTYNIQLHQKIKQGNL